MEQLARSGLTMKERGYAGKSPRRRRLEGRHGHVGLRFGDRIIGRSRAVRLLFRGQRQDGSELSALHFASKQELVGGALGSLNDWQKRSSRNRRNGSRDPPHSRLHGDVSIGLQLLADNREEPSRLDCD